MVSAVRNIDSKLLWSAIHRSDRSMFASTSRWRMFYLLTETETIKCSSVSFHCADPDKCEINNRAFIKYVKIPIRTNATNAGTKKPSNNLRFPQKCQQLINVIIGRT